MRKIRSLGDIPQPFCVLSFLTVFSAVVFSRSSNDFDQNSLRHSGASAQPVAAAFENADFHLRENIQAIADSYLSVRALAQEFVGFLLEQDLFSPMREEQMAATFSYYSQIIEDCVLTARAEIKTSSDELREKGLIIDSVNLGNIYSTIWQLAHGCSLLINAEMQRWLYNKPKVALANYRVAEKIFLSHLGCDHPLLIEIKREMHGCGAKAETHDPACLSNLGRLLW